jgi:hypothetical protein
MVGHERRRSAVAGGDTGHFWSNKKFIQSFLGASKIIENQDDKPQHFQ